MKTEFDRFALSIVSPRSWRVSVRRLLLLMLPLSLPIWVLLLVLLGVAFAVRGLVRMLVVIWTAPPVRRKGHDYFNYGGSQDKQARSVVRPQPPVQRPRRPRPVLAASDD